MNKNVYAILTVALVVAIGIIFFGGNKQTKNDQAQSVEIRDGVQYIRISAGGGYSPQMTKAKGGIPTKLIVKTNGTYDCSLSLAIHSINYQKVLPPTGEEVIDIGTPKTGEQFQGVCGMGMYSFEIDFS